ncbi:MAG TPA: peptidoglycan recognition family protein, partial [Myxococcota bacterium]|nr:peptidoglycan recognition family protein [Myxococcota bacterium]
MVGVLPLARGVQMAVVTLEQTMPTSIVDRTAHSPAELRKGAPRPPGKVWALVLHQMAFSRGSVQTRYDRVNAHFAILPDGTILQLHPTSALLWASNGFNAGSVAVEFAGNLPDTRGRCWEATRFGCHRVTDAQITAGRALVDHLIATIGLTHVLAHRQSSGSRENDPGPDLWYHVGQWAAEARGMSDGGPGFKVGTGNPIPDAWRTWGQAGRPGHRGMAFEIDMPPAVLGRAG